MHIVQERLLSLARHQDLGKMTLRQIARLINEDHPQKVKHHLLQLQKRGLIRIDEAGSTIQAVERHTSASFSVVSIPIVGSANCGEATIFAEENIEGYLQISNKLLHGSRTSGLFALTAQGDSMDNANIKGSSIESGDYVIVDSEDITPQNGDYIVSAIDGMANIKRYWFDGNHDRIVLSSESKRELPPIFIHQDDDYLINGKVVQVIKPFRPSA